MNITHLDSNCQLISRWRSFRVRFARRLSLCELAVQVVLQPAVGLAKEACSNDNEFRNFVSKLLDPADAIRLGSGWPKVRTVGYDWTETEYAGTRWKCNTARYKCTVHDKVDGAASFAGIDGKEHCNAHSLDCHNWSLLRTFSSAVTRYFQQILLAMNSTSATATCVFRSNCDCLWHARLA